MRIETDPRLPDNLPAMLRPLVLRLYDLFRKIASQLNGLSEGSIVAAYNAATSAPTTGTFQRGDQIRHSEPSEQGAPGAKYIITGFICVAGGEPGTWREMRSLTGN